MHPSRRKKIAYYTINDPLDKRSWSGITYYLGRALQQHVGDVDFLGPVPIPWALDKTCRALQKASRLLLRSEWIPKYSLLKNMYAAWYLGRKMKGQQYDFVMAPSAAPELAYLSTDVPIVYFGDATYKIYSETYAKEFANMGALTRWEGNHLENKSLHKSRFAILTSNWAATSASPRVTSSRAACNASCACRNSSAIRASFSRAAANCTEVSARTASARARLFCEFNRRDAAAFR